MVQTISQSSLASLGLEFGIEDRRIVDKDFFQRPKIEAHAYIQNTQKWRVDKQNMGTARRIAEPEPAGR